MTREVPAMGLSSVQAARYLGVSQGTLRRWADEGMIEHYRTPGGQRRFSQEQLDRFVAATVVRQRPNGLVRP